MSNDTAITPDTVKDNEKTLIANFETSMNVVNEAPLKKDFEVIVPKEESTIIDKTTDVTSSKNTPEMPNENPQLTEMEDYDPKKDLSDYKAPSLDLLKVYNSTGKDVDMQEQTENKDKIIRTLHNYGIEILPSTRRTSDHTLRNCARRCKNSRIKNLETYCALFDAFGIASSRPCRKRNIG
jgi:S-DNA-T family DNA segregation ATPase FtsK/SpoIIIE